MLLIVEQVAVEVAVRAGAVGAAVGGGLVTRFVYQGSNLEGYLTDDDVANFQAYCRNIVTREE